MSAPVAGAVGLAVVLAAAAVLRVWALARAPVNPFYDAAVRSMGLSWHNFFFGALEPGGRISVDKPPIDLWLQVASTQLFGFNTTALLLPEALGGIAAAGLLWASIRPVFGLGAATLAGLALAVMPISVVTSRSDTMDSVMSAVLVGALWASVRALRTRHVRWVVAAAALVGLAFNVKLSEALVPLPALGLMWLAVADGGRRRALAVAGAAAAFVAVGMAWIVVASLTPAGHRPYPVGSRDGSIYQAVFVYNGVERLNGTSAQVAPVGSASPPGPTRLLGSAHPFYGTRVGVELVAALALGAACALAGLARLAGPRRRRRVGRGRRGGPGRAGRGRRGGPGRAGAKRRGEAGRAGPSRGGDLGRAGPSRRAEPGRAGRASLLAAELDRDPAERSGGGRPTAADLNLAPGERSGGDRPTAADLDHDPGERSGAGRPPAPRPADGATPLPARLAGEPVPATRPQAPADPLAAEPVPASPPQPAADLRAAPRPGPAAESAATTARRRLPAEDSRTRRWLTIGVLVWLLTACALFSVVRDLQPRYLEAVTPALAAAVGLGASVLRRRAARQRAAALGLLLALAVTAWFAATVGGVPGEAVAGGLAAAGVAGLALLLTGRPRLPPRLGRVAGGLVGLAGATAVLAAPVGVSIALVDANATAAGVMGSGAEFADYIHAHRHGAYYEVASTSVYAVTTLIVHDAQPVLVLDDFHGPLVTLQKLIQLVELRALRHVIISHACRSGPHCPATTIWSLAHAREVVRGGLYEYVLPLTLSPRQVCATPARRRADPTCHGPLAPSGGAAHP